MNNARYALRTLRASPGFTAVALGTLALGIGANTVIFSAVDAVLLRPLPYPGSDRIVQVTETAQLNGIVQRPSSVPKFDFLRARVHSLQPFAAMGLTGFQMTSEHADPAQIAGARVSAGFFDLFGVEPLLGRTFLPAEDLPGGPAVAVIRYSLWQNRFAGDPGVVGRSIGLNGESATIVGVMPAAFDFPDSAQIWTPRVFEQPLLTRVEIDHGAGFLLLYGRLNNGVDTRQAATELNALSKQYDAAHAGFGDTGHALRLRSLRDTTVADIRTTLLVLWGAVGFVLLIASANIANLLLSRALARRKEIAIRVSLGATRGRLLVQFLTESVILSALGGALGVLLACWGTGLIDHLNSGVLPRAGEVHIDARALLFTAAVALATGVLFGLGPALHALRFDLNRALKESARSVSAGGRLRGIVVTSEVALAMALLSGAGLLMRSFANLEHVDPGFRSTHLLSATLPLAPARYPKTFARTAFFDQALSRISALPGVEQVSLNSAPPIRGGYGIGYTYAIEGRPAPEQAKLPVTFLRNIDPDYFRTMGIALRRGRTFTATDTAGTVPVAIINQTMARRQWPDEDPIGRRVVYSREQTVVEVVGVVADVKFAALGDTAAYEEMYVPYRQKPSFTMSLLVRGRGNPADLAATVRQEIARIDPEQPVSNVQTMDDALAGSIARPRLETALMAGFATVALLLAALGIFGVVAWSVSQRTNEIGIRMALGAAPGNVLAMIIGQAFRTIGAGQALGLAGALLLTRFLKSVLFGVSAHDPLTFATVILVLGATALIACLLAARRAIGVDPVIALRQE